MITEVTEAVTLVLWPLKIECHVPVWTDREGTPEDVDVGIDDWRMTVMEMGKGKACQRK